VNLKFILKQEGKCNWKELVQRAQVIERDVLETGANILNFLIYFQGNKGMDFEENFDERHELFLDLVLGTENKDYNVLIQEKYHPLHAPLKGISTSHVINLRVMIIMNSKMNTRILFNIIMMKTLQQILKWHNLFISSHKNNV
jgi:hypothetical protein